MYSERSEWWARRHIANCFVSLPLRRYRRSRNRGGEQGGVRFAVGGRLEWVSGSGVEGTSKNIFHSRVCVVELS